MLSYPRKNKKAVELYYHCLNYWFSKTKFTFDGSTELEVFLIDLYLCHLDLLTEEIFIYNSSL